MGKSTKGKTSGTRRSKAKSGRKTVAKRKSTGKLTTTSGSGLMAASMLGSGWGQLPDGTKIKAVFQFLVYEASVQYPGQSPTPTQLMGLLNASSSPWRSLVEPDPAPPFDWEDQLEGFLEKCIVAAADRLRALLPPGTTERTNQYEQCLIRCAVDRMPL